MDFVPTDDGLEKLTLSKKQIKVKGERILALGKKLPGEFLDYPEKWGEKFDGCLTAGRGFIHISSEGNVEPF